MLRIAIAPLALALALVARAARRAPARARRRRRCSTSPTTRRASSTRSSTPPSPSTGRRRPARSVDDQAVARRLRQAGARGDRRPRGRRRHARARLRHRRDRRAAASLIPRTGRSGCRNNSAPYTSTIVFLVRKGNPKGIKDWDDLVQAGRRGDHAEPEDLGRRALELPRGLGLRAASKPGGDEAKATAFVARLYKNVPGARHGRARLDDHLRRARHRRRAARLGERGAPRASKELGQGQVRDRRAVAQHPGRAAGRGRRQGRRQARHARGRRRRTSSTSTRPKAQEIAAKHYYRPRDRGGAPRSTRRSSRSSSCSRSTRSSAAGRRRRQTHFADGGVFDQIYEPRSAERAPHGALAHDAQRAAGLRAHARLHARLPRA